MKLHRMQLHRLRVDQFRQFRQPFELTALEPGLNIFAGPNEAGKSTLVRAIRAAFFERHRSASVDDLLPWGEPSATPSVELDFSVGGADYQLRKSFMHRKRCELKVITNNNGAKEGRITDAGTKTLDGEDAEQHLAELFGFSFAAKGASRPEHWGIPGLLWIEQGSAQNIVESVGSATEHLRRALDDSIGEVASSQGDDVINRVRKERDALLTNAGKPRGAYAAVITEREVAVKRLEELDGQIAKYREQVDQLGRMRAESAADAAAKPWEALRSQQRQAEGRLAKIAALKAQLGQTQASLKQFDDNRKLVEEQLAGFDEQQLALKQREADLLEAERLVQAAKAADDTWVAASREAEVAYQKATEQLAIAREHELRVDLERRASEALVRVTALTEAIAKSETEQAQLTAHRKLAVESEIDKADIARLREQHAKLNELRIRQDAAATRVQFDLQTTAAITLAGQRLSGRGEQLITTSAEINIPNVGRLQIIPGGADLAELARDEAELRAAHQALLQRLGLQSLVDAENRFATHQQALKDIKHSEKALANLAPKGLDALRAELFEAATRKLEAAGQLAQIDQSPNQSTDQSPAPVDAVAETSAQTAARQQAAHKHLEKIARQAAGSKQALNTAQTQSDAARRERDALNGLLNDPSRQQRVRDTGQRLLVVRAECDSLRQRVSTQQGEVDAARPEILAQDVERFKRSADQAERAFSERQTSMTLLQGMLEHAGAQGLEEERAEQAARADAADRRYKELKLRAEALDLLLSLLESKRRELTKRLQAPLQKHVNRYLQLLFAQATLDVGENLVPGLLTRVGEKGLKAGSKTSAETGPVAELSFGAREQMGVISRLAYADLLKEAGRPTLIILDDALVHSDDQRLGQMKRVLFDAAQRHQVLLFTCHPNAWRDMGAAPRPIAQ